MRIRKNAKISPLMLNGVVLQSHVCKLNQSTWDAMSFSPPRSSTSTPQPPPQVNGDRSSAANGSGSRDSIPVPKREISGWRPDNYPGNITTSQLEDPPPPSQAAAEEVIILCGKTDGKSWHCQREASKGNSLCDHHLSQAKSYYTSGNSSVGPPKKSGKQATEAPPPRRVRSNPYDFYYYSGFGPRWGKKRDGEICGGSDKNAGHEDESELPPPPPLDEEDDDFAYVDSENLEEVRENNGRKRPRKPIKERSLKSLM